MPQYCLTAFVQNDSDFTKKSRVYLLNWSPGFVTVEVYGKSKIRLGERIVKSVNAKNLCRISFGKAPEDIKHKFSKIYNSESTVRKITESFNRKVSSSRVTLRPIMLPIQNTGARPRDTSLKEALMVGFFALVLTLVFAYIELKDFYS